MRINQSFSTQEPVMGASDRDEAHAINSVLLQAIALRRRPRQKRKRGSNNIETNKKSCMSTDPTRPSICLMWIFPFNIIRFFHFDGREIPSKNRLPNVSEANRTVFGMHGFTHSARFDSTFRNYYCVSCANRR